MINPEVKKALENAVSAQKWDAAALLIARHRIDPDYNDGEIWNSAEQKTDIFHMIENLGCSALTRGAMKRFARSETADEILLFMENGVDIHAPSPVAPLRFLDYFVIEKNIANECLIRLITQGADPKGERQAILKDCIRKGKYPYVHHLVKAGGDLNADEGRFLYEALFARLDYVKSTTGSIKQLLHAVDYLMLLGAAPALDRSGMLARLQTMDNPQAKMLHDNLQARIERQMHETRPLDPRFFHGKTFADLRGTFNINGRISSGLVHAALGARFAEALKNAGHDTLKTRDLLQKDQRGLRVIDYLAAQKQLGLVFHPRHWHGREAEAIDLCRQLRPQYRRDDLIVPLKLSRIGRRPDLRSLPVTRRKG